MTVGLSSQRTEHQMQPEQWQRHVSSFFELKADERAELLALLDKTTPEAVGPDPSNPYSRFK